MIDRLLDALSGRSTELESRFAALVVLAGISAARAKHLDLTDDELRPMLARIIDRTLGRPQQAHH